MGARQKRKDEKGKNDMTRQDLLINIENYIDEISAYENGRAAVGFALEKLGVDSIYELTESGCQDLFNELFDIAAGMD